MNRLELLASALATCGLSISDAQPFAEKLEAAAEGNEVLEYQMAMLCCMFYNAHKRRSAKPLYPEDFMPRMNDAERMKVRGQRNREKVEKIKKFFAKESSHV